MAQPWTEGFETPSASRPVAFTEVVVQATPDVLRRARKWLLISGILAIVVGAAAIAVPAVASVTVAIFIGWILVCSGVLMGIHAYSDQDNARKALRFLTAALTLAAGIYILVAPLSGTVTLTFILGAWFFAIGFVHLLEAYRLRGFPGAGWVAFNGALALILGGLISANLPSSADWAIGLLVGINLLFWGIRALLAASLLKRALEA